LLSAAFITILIGPLHGLIISFGVEYGWRGFPAKSVDPSREGARRISADLERLLKERKRSII
ncbi:MAG TPA: hypothetical protein VF326_01155, partial [Anaerolineaceae bacterium]